MSRAATRLADQEPSLASTTPEPEPGPHQESGDEPLAGPQVFYGNYSVIWQPLGAFPYEQMQILPAGDQPRIHFAGTSELWPATYSHTGEFPRLTGDCVVAGRLYIFSIDLLRPTPPRRWLKGHFVSIIGEGSDSNNDTGPIEVGMWGAEDDGGQKKYKRSPEDAPTPPRPHLLRP